MVQVQGSCPDCHIPIVYVQWTNGKLEVIVQCQSCGEELHFDLVKMMDSLGTETDSGIVLCEEPKMVQ